MWAQVIPAALIRPPPPPHTHTQQVPLAGGSAGSAESVDAAPGAASVEPVATITSTTFIPGRWSGSVVMTLRDRFPVVSCAVRDAVHRVPCILCSTEGWGGGGRGRGNCVVLLRL